MAVLVQRFVVAAVVADFVHFDFDADGAVAV
jgi:hypothetical protein